MKYPFVTLIWLFALNGFSQKKQLPLKVLEATSRDWVSGADGRTGTKYTIKIFIRTIQKIEFVNLWLGKDNVPFQVEFYNVNIQKRIQQGDTLLLTFNRVKGEKSENADAKRLPIDYNGGALIEATVSGKARYFIVSGIQVLPDLKGD